MFSFVCDCGINPSSYSIKPKPKSRAQWRWKKLQMVVKEIRRVLSFIFSIEFLRMGIFWTLSLLISHLRLFNGRLCARYSFTYSRQLVASNSTAKRPICIITGVIFRYNFFIIFLFEFLLSSLILICYFSFSGVFLMTGDIWAWSCNCPCPSKRGFLGCPGYGALF